MTATAVGFPSERLITPSHMFLLHYYEKERWLNTLKRKKEADEDSEWSSSRWMSEILSDPAATRRSAHQSAVKKN